MSTIQFISVEIEGFRSIVEPMVFNLNRPGINMLVAPNGFGKTSIIESIVWCLYGINLKATKQEKIASWPEVRTPAWQGTRVSVVFRKEINSTYTTYRVVRHLDYKGLTADVRGEDSLMIFKYDQMENDPRNKDASQQLINSLLTVDSQTFINSVVFGQRMAKLIEQDNGDKRDLFETLFDSKWVAELKKRVDLKLTEIRNNLVELASKKLVYQGIIDSTTESMNNEEETFRSFEAGRQTRLREQEEKLEGFNTELSTTQTLIHNAEEFIKEINFDIESFTSLNSKLTEIEDSISKLYELKADKETAILTGNYEIKIETLRKEIKQLEESPIQVTDISVKEVELNRRQTELDKALEAFNSLKKKCAEAKYSEQQYNDFLTKFDESINGLTKEITILESKIKDVENSVMEVPTLCEVCPRIPELTTDFTNKKAELLIELRGKLKSVLDKKIEHSTKREAVNECIRMFNSLHQMENDYPILESVVAALKNEIESIKSVNASQETIRATEIKSKLTLLTTIVETSKKLESDLLDIDNKISLLDTEKADIDAELLSLQPGKEQYDIAISNIDTWTNDLVDIQKDITTTKENIKAIKAEKQPLRKTSEFEAKISQNKTLLSEVDQSIALNNKELEIAQWYSTKALSSSGLKAYIFKAMLGNLNRLTKVYGQRLGITMEFSIDLTKASKPFTTMCSIGDKLNKDYKEFSGGQKQRLDIVLIFAMFDLISLNTDFNIIIMDEVFAGLDEEGENAVFDLIRVKAEEGKSVYLVNHSSTIDSLYLNKIEIGYEDGRTFVYND